MAMDSSWFHGYATDNTTGNNGFMCGYAASCIPGLQHKEDEEEEPLISSQQIQHHLNQISMHMMDDDEAVYDGACLVDSLLDPHHDSSFPSSSSSSSLSLRSASISCSPESSAHILGAPAPVVGAAAGQYLEVSSHVPPLPPPAVPYTNTHAPAAAVPVHRHDAATAAMAPVVLPPAAAKTTSAFKRFARHLGPRRPPKPGACGQRMFKTALSVLSKMHVAASARYSQQYYYQQAPAEAAPPPSVNQLQHMISERKRREKLNDSFHALRAVLPPGAKKDKTSILIRAREYIKSLESRSSELEEKNKSLESRLTQAHQRGDISDARRQHAGDDDADSGEKVQIEITRATKEEYWAVDQRDLCTLKIEVRSGCNVTDVVLRTLQCLKEQVGDDVALVSMNTSGSSPQMGSSPRAVLTMQIKSSPGAKWEEQPVKDAVAKVVAETSTTAPAPHQRQ